MKALLVVLLAAVPAIGLATPKEKPVTRQATKAELQEVQVSVKEALKMHKRLEKLVDTQRTEINKLIGKNSSLEKENKALKNHVIQALRKRTSLIVMSAVVGLILGCVVMGLIKR